LPRFSRRAFQLGNLLSWSFESGIFVAFECLAEVAQLSLQFFVLLMQHPDFALQPHYAFVRAGRLFAPAGCHARGEAQAGRDEKCRKQPHRKKE
jgi:hypothetical protein